MMPLYTENWAFYSLATLFFGVLAFLFTPYYFGPMNYQSFPREVPVSGLRQEWFALIRASMRQLTTSVSTLMDGYQKVVPASYLFHFSDH